MTTRALPEKFLIAFSLAGEQRDFVRSIAEAVEKELGFGTVFFDEWFEAYLAGASADLKLQEIYGEKCELAVFCISREYHAKPWTSIEHEAIRARLMTARSSSDQRAQLTVLPIRVGDGDVRGILFNTIAPDVRDRSAIDTASLIIERLRHIVPDLRTAAGKALALPDWPAGNLPLSWPMADHTGVREAFGELLTAGARWRFLPVRGATETGKSHVTRQMLANALALPTIACGRFDFKGTTDMDREICSFIQELGVPLPPANPRLHDRLDHILSCLRRRGEPALLIFDTYEMAGESQEWVEKQLLQSLIRAPWLRVVIAGQRVPDSTGAVWAAVGRPTLQLEPPPPADWFDYGKQHRPGLTLDDVTTACRLASHRASILAQLLGPTG